MSEELKKKLAECQKQKEEYLAGWKKERADFLNYKKEEEERMDNISKYCNEELILKILPILDSIYIAQDNIPKELKENLWIKGFSKIREQLVDFLKNEGVEEIKALGRKFDPNFHEAVEEVKKEGTGPQIIVEELKKGYLFGSKVIRPAKVKVSK